MEKIKSVWMWFMVSSVDPTKVSLTVRGFLMAAVPFIVLSSGLMNFSVDEEGLIAIVEVVSTVILQALTIIGTLRAAYGLFRKVFLK